MSLYERVERWEVPERLIEASIREMAPDGLQGCEGIVLWLGKVSRGVARIEHLIGLTGPLILKLPDYLRIDPDLFNQIADFSEARNLCLVGQIHSHPGTFVDLSHADITYGVSAPYYLSVVAPYYAQDPASGWSDCGVHMYEPERGLTPASWRSSEAYLPTARTRGTAYATGWVRMVTHVHALSRPLACAASLGRYAADAGRFPDKHVLLTGESEIVKTANGRWIALDSLRLLIRICRFVDIWLPEGTEALEEEIKALAVEIAFTQPVRILHTEPEYGAYDAILCVGTRVAYPNTTVVNSNGWLVRISSSMSIASECNLANPIGALAAASFGVGEMFKRLVDVKSERGPYFDGLTFSLVSFEEGEQDPGPALPTSYDLPLTLVAGQGAIGNSLVLLLGQLTLKGEVLLLDRQYYGPENLGTSVLLGPSGIAKRKAEENARWLNRLGGLRATPVFGPIEELLPAFGKELPQPVIVLSGLDSVEARHSIQDLWPDIVVDGAIGEFSCQAAIHLWGRGMACLKCLFDLPAAPDPEVTASLETGLSAERIRDAEAVVDSTDVNAAPTGKRELLKTNLGRKICSVVSEAMLARVAKNNSGGGFSPSAPFVATLSGALVVALLLKQLMGYRVSPARYYVDILSGPRFGERFNEPARSSCICQTRGKLISEVRSLRATAGSAQNNSDP